MLSDLWHYGSAVGQKWYALVTGVLFVLGQLLQAIWPRGKAWLDARWSPKQRRPVEITALVAILLFAGFEAYRDEHAARLKAETRVASAEAQLASTKRDLATLGEKAVAENPPRSSNGAVVPPRGPAKRLVNYGGVGFDTASQGEDALAIKEIYFDIKNVGDDPIRLRLTKGSVLIGSRPALICGTLDAKYVGKGEAMHVSCKPPPQQEALVGLDTQYLQMRTEVDYDTIPPTGNRTSIRVSRAPVVTPRRGVSGFGFNAFELITSVER
jgi:hypothetical protein